MDKRRTGACPAGSKTPNTFLTLQKVVKVIFGDGNSVCKNVGKSKKIYKIVDRGWFSGKSGNFGGGEKRFFRGVRNCLQGEKRFCDEVKKSFCDEVKKDFFGGACLQDEKVISVG